MKISNGKMNIWSSLVLLQVLHYGLAYRILAVIPFSGKSHYLNMQPIVQEMADRGHDVTVIATYPEKNPNYKQIVLERKLIWEGLGEKFDLFALNTAVFEKTMDLAWRGTFFTTETALNSSLLQDFIKNDNSHFDLIFTEIFYQEALYMFAHKYNAPIIGFCTMGFTQSIGDIMGSPLILNYMAHEYLTFGSPMTVAQKFRNIYSTLYELFWRHFYHLPLHQKLAEKHFGHLPGKLPQIADIEKNISLILLNTHYSSDIVRPYVPGIIEVGGAHIRKPKELPEMKMLISLFVSMLFFQYALAYRILAVIPFSGKSHYMNIQPVVEELANRGHDVTVIATFAEKNPPYKQIVLERKTFWDAFGENHDIYALNTMTFEETLDCVWEGAYFTTEAAFNSTKMQDFIKNDNSHFDLVFTEIFYQESMYMFAHKYNAPLVGFSTSGFSQLLGNNMGNPLMLAYMSHEYLPFASDMSFFQKIKNAYSTVYDLVWRYYYLLPKHQKLAEKHFSHLPKPLPRLQDIEKNMSAVLINTHFSTDIIRPYIPGIVEIGGAHIKTPMKLPENLQKFLDGAKYGAIYFSLGTNVQCKDMPKEKLDIFLRVFGKLKQRVLWKWEEEIMTGKPDNVMTGKWMPQSDILAHPNMKLFVSHGGLLSTLESTSRGVPIIGIPMYGDQHLNTQRMENAGNGLKIPYTEVTEAALETAINEILHNPKYEKRAKELSARFNDRPMSALDTAVFWIEYVIRHKGAPFMKSPLSNLSLFEYHIFELGSVVLLLFLTFISVIYIFLRFIYKLFSRIKSQNNIKHTKKNDKKQR